MSVLRSSQGLQAVTALSYFLLLAPIHPALLNYGMYANIIYCSSAISVIKLEEKRQLNTSGD